MITETINLDSNIEVGWGPRTIFENKSIKDNNYVSSDDLYYWDHEKMIKLSKKYLLGDQDTLLDGVKVSSMEDLLKDYFELDKVEISRISKGIHDVTKCVYFFIEFNDGIN